jgi:hypothetical protein
MVVCGRDGEMWSYVLGNKVVVVVVVEERRDGIQVDGGGESWSVF